VQQTKTVFTALKRNAHGHFQFSTNFLAQKLNKLLFLTCLTIEFMSIAKMLNTIDLKDGIFCLGNSEQVQAKSIVVKS